MSARGYSSASYYKILSLASTAMRRYRNPTGNRTSPSSFYGCQHHGLRFINGDDPIRSSPSPHNTPIIKNDKNRRSQSTPSPPPIPIFSSWAKWILGSILTLILPAWKLKWESFLTLEGKVKTAVEDVEQVAEVVEKVATTTEKLSAEVAEKLPDNSKLKETALLLEHASFITAKDARVTQDFIHKVGDLKQDLEDLKKIVEPVIDKVVQVEEAGVPM